MLDYKFDTQLLIEGKDLSEDGIIKYITENFHTNTPWKVLEYCASLGDIYDVVVENMQRQENGLQG